MALKLNLKSAIMETALKSNDPLNRLFPLVCWDGALQELQAVYPDVLSHFKGFFSPPKNNLNLYLGIRRQYPEKIVFSTFFMGSALILMQFEPTKPFPSSKIKCVMASNTAG